MKTLLEVIDLTNEPNILNQITMTETKTMKASKRGRKPVADKKQQITLYVPSSKIEKSGGMDRVKLKLYSYLKVS